VFNGEQEARLWTKIASTWRCALSSRRYANGRRVADISIDDAGDWAHKEHAHQRPKLEQYGEALFVTAGSRCSRAIITRARVGISKGTSNQCTWSPGGRRDGSGRKPGSIWQPAVTRLRTDAVKQLTVMPSLGLITGRSLPTIEHEIDPADQLAEAAE
jgi:hypothetical protein